MTLFWGICLIFFGLTVNSEAYLPENIKESINHLNNHYVRKNTNTDELYDGHSLFLEKMKVLEKKFEESEQKLLMAIILDAYNRIFIQMENETQDKNVKHDLKEVKDQMNRLREHYFSGKHADLKTYISEMLALKESDPLIQRKAVFELKTIYNKAANLGHLPAQNQRRRRQAKGYKKQRS